MSPTQRSLKYLRSQGYLVAIVEHWNPWVKVRKDLFGIIDLLAVDKTGTLAVQTTTHANAKARVRKILASPHLEQIVAAGWTVRVHGWKSPTKKDKKWTLTSIDIAAHGSMLQMFAEPKTVTIPRDPYLEEADRDASRARNRRLGSVPARQDSDG